MKHVLIYSCNEYKETENYRELRLANKDANDFKEVLSRYYDFEEKDISIEELNPYYKKNVADILDDIRKINESAEEGDTIIFYYSGHGDSKNNNSYLILPDTKKNDLEGTALPLNNVIDILSGNNKLNIILLDCCHSGQPISLHKYMNHKGDYGTGVVCLAACKLEQTSEETGEISNGIFTYSLLEVLKNFEIGKSISIQELILEVYKKFRSIKMSEDKQNIVLSSFIIGDAIIAKRSNNFNKGNIYEVLKNMKFLDKKHLLDEIKKFENQCINIGKITLEREDYDSKNEIFYFKLQDDNIVNLINKNIKKIVNFDQSLLFFKTTENIARKIINEKPEITLNGKIAIVDEQIVFTDIKLISDSYLYNFGGIINCSAKELIKMKNRVIDFEFYNNWIVCIDKDGSIEYYDLLNECKINSINIMNQNEILLKSQLYADNSGIVILGLVENNDTQNIEIRVYRINNSEVNQSTVEFDSTDKFYGFTLFNENKFIGLLTDKKYGYKELINNTNELKFADIKKRLIKRKKYKGINFSNDGKHFSLYSDKNVLLFDINNIENPIKIFQKNNIKFAKWLGNDEIVIVSFDNYYYIININFLEDEKQFKEDYEICDILKSENNLLCISIKGNSYCNRENEKFVKCSISEDSKKSILLKGHNVDNIKMSPDGKILLGVNNNSVVKWDIFNPEKLFK